MFSKAFMFSVETMSTIGYGEYTVSADCPGAIMVITLQTLIVVISDGLILGVMYARFSR